MKLKELLEKRAQLQQRAAEISAKRDAEKRQDYTAEEQANVDAISIDYQDVCDQITKERADVEKLIGQPITAPTMAVAQQTFAEEGNRAIKHDAEREMKAIGNWLMRSDEPGEIAAAGLTVRRNKLVIPFAQKRALGDSPQTITTTAGGYMIPRGFSYVVEQALLQYNPLDSLATVLTTAGGNPIDYPTINDTTSAGADSTINSSVADGALTFGTVTVNAYKADSGMITVPTELMEDSAFDMATFCAEQIGTRLGRHRANAAMNGSGSSTWNGVKTWATSAATTAASTSVTSDELLTLLHAVDPAYRVAGMNCGWMMKDATLLKIRQLKDANGAYLLDRSLSMGTPDTLLGFPIYINAACPAATAGLKPIFFGAFKKVLIRNVGEIRVKRLVERFAEKDQEAFIGFMRYDVESLDAGTNPIKCLTMKS